MKIQFDQANARGTVRFAFMEKVIVLLILTLSDKMNSIFDFHLPDLNRWVMVTLSDSTLHFGRDSKRGLHSWADSWRKHDCLHDSSFMRFSIFVNDAARCSQWLEILMSVVREGPICNPTRDAEGDPSR